MARSLLVGMISMALSGFHSCYPGGAPSPGDHQLPISFQHWNQPGYCSATDVSMWIRYVGTPYPSSQQDIVDYMSFEYWWWVGPDGSMAPEAIQQALWEYSNINTEDHFYVGATEKRQGVADIKKGIQNGNPVIVITDYGLHAKLVKGGSWTQLPNYQPQIELITTADPAEYGFRTDQVGYWVDLVGGGEPYGEYIRSIQRYGQASSAASELAEFDYWGGTYYGEEDPPDGCPECPPEAVPTPSLLGKLVGLMRPPAPISATMRPSIGLRPNARNSRRSQGQFRRGVGPERQENHAVRKRVFVPKPYSTRSQDVITNMLAGMRQSHLSQVEGWEDLDGLLDRGRVTVTSVDHVESLTHDHPYWLLALAVDHQPFGKAIVSEEGWLLSGLRFTDQRGSLGPRTATWAREQAGAMARGGAVRLVHMTNALTDRSGSSDYEPFYEVPGQGGTPLYVSQEGMVFTPAAEGAGVAYWKSGQVRLKRVR